MEESLVSEGSMNKQYVLPHRHNNAVHKEN